MTPERCLRVVATGATASTPSSRWSTQITRSEGRGREPLLPEQGLRLQDIVDAYTINAAFALKQEHTTGSVEPGKRGDFIVLDRDIFTIDPFEIHETKVLATYLDGREVLARGR